MIKSVCSNWTGTELESLPIHWDPVPASLYGPLRPSFIQIFEYFPSQKALKH